MSFQEEKKKFRTLDFKGKMQYIWDYYKLPIIVIILAAIFITSIVQTMIKNSVEVVLNGYFINSYFSEEDTEQLAADFAAYAGINLNDVNINMDANISYNPEATDQMTYAALTKITAMIQLQEIDFIICDRKTFEYFSSMEAFTDLPSILPEVLYKTSEQDFIEATDSDTGNIQKVGLPVESTVLANAYTEPVYFGILKNGSHTETSIRFLEYMLQP